MKNNRTTQAFLLLFLVLSFLLPFHRTNAAYPSVIFQGCITNLDPVFLTGDRSKMYTILLDANRSGNGGGAVTTDGFTWNGQQPGCFQIYQNVLTPPAQYTLQIQQLTTTGTNTYHNQEFPIDLRDQSSMITQNFELVKPTKFITGKVVDTKGDPAVGQSVTARRLDAEGNNYWNNTVAFVKTDVNGLFTVGIGTGAGQYTISADGDGTTFLESHISNGQVLTFTNTTAPETQEAKLTLYRISKETHITGTVLNSEGVGTNDTTVFANLQNDWSFGSYARTDSTGAFSLNLTPGTYTVHAQQNTYEPGKWVDYPWFSVTVEEGQTVDLGKIAPTNTLKNPTGFSDSPDVFLKNNTLLQTKERTQTVQTMQFVDSFDSRTFVNTSASTGVQYAKSSVTLTSLQQQVQTRRVSATSTIAQSSVISKRFTPVGVTVRSVTLTDQLNPTDRGSLQYSISGDGETWVNILEGKPFTIQQDMDTTKGLRWRATLIGSSTQKSVKLEGIQVIYTRTRGTKIPTITHVSTQLLSGGRTKVTIRGKNFSAGTSVFLGNQNLTGVQRVNNTTMTVTLKRSVYTRSSYSLSLIDPQIRLTKTSLRVYTRLAKSF